MSTYRRRGLLVITTLATALAIAVVVVLASGALNSTPPATSAPKCLPTSVEHSARLAGVPVDVSPAPGTLTANPDTQISFLGVPSSEIHAVAVRGRRSGPHAGRLQAYSQGDGASFLPDVPFRAGEEVYVRALIGPLGAGKRVAFDFRVDTPYPTAHVPPYENPPAQPGEYESYDTMPGVKAPLLSVTVPDRDPAAGDIFTSNGPGPGAYGPLIYTPQGQLVWFDQLAHGLTAEDVNVQEYEGRRDLTFWQGKVLDFGFGQGEDVVLNSAYQTVARVRGGNGLRADLHEFQIAPHDIAYITAYNPIRCNLSSVKGPSDGSIDDTAVQEIDMKTGLVRWEWHSLDHVSVSESQVAAPSTRPWDWFHLNSIDPEPNGDILLSARSTWTVYQLEGGSGRILWRLGGPKSSFHLGPGTKTAWQHDARMLPDGEVTLFDDGSNPPIHSQSRGLRIRLDFTTREATLAAVYDHHPPLLAASQGNMQTLPSGNVVIDYGGVPAITEYSPSGSILFDAHLPYDLISYRGYRHPWSARPAAPPTVVANLNNTGEETIVHASWNGATGVAAWRVLAGNRSGALSARSTIASQGFESSTILTQDYPYVAVQALGSKGQMLGTSEAIKPSGYAASLPGGGAQ